MNVVKTLAGLGDFFFRINLKMLQQLQMCIHTYFCIYDCAYVLMNLLSSFKIHLLKILVVFSKYERGICAKKDDKILGLKVELI